MNGTEKVFSYGHFMLRNFLNHRRNLPPAYRYAHSGRPKAVIFRSLLAAVLSIFVTAPIDTMAQAVGNVDWVVTIADTAVGSPPKNYDPTSAGSTIQYAVTVANSGYSAAQPTTITFDIPATTTFTGVTGSLTNCQPSPATGQTLVACDVPGLASGGQEAAIISVLTTVSGTVEVTATVPATGDVDPNNNSGSEVTTVRSAADMSLTLNAPARAVSGGLITYGFTATNSGPDPVSNLNLTFPVPTGITSVAAPAGCTLSGSSYACTIAGPVTVGASVTRNFTGRVFAVSGSDITAAGSISGGSEFDPVLANNTATATTRVDPGTTLDIEKTRSPAQVFVNDIVTFTLTNRYTGESPTGISVVDTLPPNYGNIGVNAPGWNVVVSGQTVTATLVSGSGAGANKDLGNIVITATALTSGTAPNTATITATGPGTVTPDTDTDGTGTILDAIVDLKANKSGPSPALAVVGNSYNFPISASNIGNKAFAGTLQMTDTIPPNLTVTSLTLNGWTCTPSSPLPLAGPGTISCERIYTAGSPLAPNATSPAVVVGATVTGTGSIVNSLNVGSPTEPETGLLANNTISYGITATTGPNSADIAVLKTAAISPVAAGDIETFRIEITNAGPRPSTNITLTDELTQLINNSNSGANPGLVSVTPQANSASGLSCTSATLGGTGRKLTCTIPSLPVCSAGVNCPVIEVKVRPGGNGGSRTNTAEAYSADVPDSAVANNTASASYTVDARADVTVTKTSSPNPVRAGQDLTYVIAARNISNGLSSAGAVTITDTLPPNLTFVSATSVQGTCGTKPAANSLTGASSNNLVICNLGNIANGAQRTVTVVVRPTLTLVDQALANNVNVTTTTTETNASNNSALNETPVLPPQLDLLVNKTDSADPVTLGEDTVYTITVTNNGPSAAENVAVTDTMPGSILSYQSYSSPADGGCGTIPGTGTFGGTLACNFPLLLAGQSRVINVTMRGEARGIATNTVTVESDETRKGYESIRNNNTAIQKTTVRARVDMEVASKTVNPTIVAPNQNFDFDIVVRNRSNAAGTDADNVLVSDTLPAGMELTGTPTVTVQAGTVTSTACTGAAGGTSVICNLGTVSPGGQVSIRVPVRVTVTTSNPQVFTNSASVSTSSLDEVAANNSNSGTVTVSIPGIELTKTASLASYVLGDTITYTFSARNSGAITLSDVSVSDPLPGLSAVSWQSNSNGSVQGTLLPGETATFTATLTVTQEQVDAGSIQNTASVTGTPPSGPAVVDDDTLTITGPTPAPALTLTKTADKASYAPGDTVTYTFEAKNTGNVTLTAVSVSDPFPGLSAVSWQSNSNGSAQGTLLPGETATFTATLTVTQEQVDAGSIQNTASVTGSPPSGPAVVDDASVTVAVDQKREIALVKKGSVQGDQVTFTYVATNTGNITLFNVSVIEERSNFSGTGALPAPAYKSGGANLDEDPADARNDLVPGESVTWTASYTMTKADIAAGVLINQAEARSKSPDGRDVADPSGTTGENDDPTRVEVKLIDIVKNELKDALSDHLQGLITVESGLFSSLAGKGAERLRSPEDCIDSDPNAVNGNFLAEYNPDGFVLNADAAVHKLLSSCAERTRYILDSQIDVRHMDEVTAATVSGTLIRETLVDEGTLFGQFAGGYFDLPAGGDDYDGTITGIGLHAGVYGARRVGDDLIADGYLAVSAGRQTFDLKLGEGLSIVAEGESRYAAGYAGAALSGEMEVRDFVVEPRVSFDTAYAMPWMESLELSLGDLQQRASLDLPELGLVRITNQFRFTPVGMTSADAGGFTWAATPLAFCQYNFGNESDLKCGGGLGLDLGYMNESRDKEFRISLSAEAAPDHYLGSGMMRYIWYIEEGRGSSEFSLGLTGQGAAQVGYSFDWKW